MRSTQSTTVSLTRVRDEVNRVLVNYFDEKIAKAEEIASSYGELWRSIARLNQSGGKRMRPYITVLAYEALKKSESNEGVYYAAASQEMLHLGVLIHDDIIDRDTIRYGVKNVTGQYDDIYESYLENESERRHFSNSAALLAGDLLISSAYELVGRSGVDNERLVCVQQLVSDAFFAVAGGELIDTEAAFRPQSSVRAMTIAEYKTASYSFISPLSVGAVLAGASEDDVARLKRFGLALGIAFQLQDDVLGVFGDEAETGKSTVSDIREGKRTRMVELFEERATDEQRATFFDIFHNHHADDAMVIQAKKLLEESGARAEAEAYIQTLCAQATAELDALNLQPEYRAAFDDLVILSTQRSK